MANENKEETYFFMDFSLGNGCNTDKTELDNVYLRSKKLDNLAKKLNLINDFKKNVYSVSIFECKNGDVTGLIYCATIKEIENWFSKRGIVL